MSELPDRIETTDEQTEEQNLQELHSFYSYKLVKESGKKIFKLSISKNQFVDLCIQLQIHKYMIKNDTCSFVILSNRRAVPAGEIGIQDRVMEYIKKLPDYPAKIEDDGATITDTITPGKVRAGFINNASNLLGKNLHFLEPISDAEFMRDTQDCKYLYFNNCIVEISKNGIQNLDYSNIDKIVWETSILARDFHYTEAKGEFELFFEDITGSNSDRKRSLTSAIGYMLHDYYEYDLMSVYLTDVNPEFETRAGGTGKGIIGKALMHVLNRNDKVDTTYIGINGNDFKSYDEKRFSRADVNTQLVHIEDAVKKFNPEDLVNDVTEGVYVRKMYADPFIKLMKILVSTNYAPDFDSPTTRRRSYVFELANYFSDKYRPSQKYKWFFGIEWNDADWNQFYSFMVRCCLTFMRDGLIKTDEVNFSNRIIFTKTCEEFVGWFLDKTEDSRRESLMQAFEKDNLFAEYVGKYGDTLSAYKKPKTAFFEWMRIFCRLKSIPFGEYRSTTDLFYIYPDEHTINKIKRQKQKIAE